MSPKQEKEVFQEEETNAADVAESEIGMHRRDCMRAGGRWVHLEGLVLDGRLGRPPFPTGRLYEWWVCWGTNWKLHF